MIIFPAIDIKDGKVVRLLQGDFEQVTEYSGSPVTVAKKWEEKGAPWLHVVDLDGAKTGQPINLDVIVEIAQTVKIPIQVGGGIRSKKNVEQFLEGGIARVVLGTKAIEDKNFLREILARWKEKIAVSLDCSNGRLAQRGWTSVTNIKATDLVHELEKWGLSCLIYTDIARDGMLRGPNFEELKELLKNTKIPVIASGGISSLEDIQKLLTLESDGVMGFITGKALYEGRFNLKEALHICSPKE